MAEDPKWTVLDSRYLRKDDWIALREDRCLTPEGVEVWPYYVLDYPDWVQVVALDGQDRILLVRQYRHGSGGFSLELPAGKMDPGDADPAATARRELLEETGCVAADARLITSAMANPATQSNRAHTVLMTGAVRVQDPVDNPRERIESFWVPIEEAAAMARAGRLTAIQVGSLFLALIELGRLELKAGA